VKKDVIQKAAAALAEARDAVEKRVVPFRSYPLQDESEPWNWTPAEFDAILRDDNWDAVASAHTWFDEEADENDPPQEKGAYKLPHHYWRDNRLVTNWRGVVAAMGALLGARGGVDVPDSERRDIYLHLAKHYREFDREAPPFDREKREKRALAALKSLVPLAKRCAEVVPLHSVGPVSVVTKFTELPAAIEEMVAHLEKSDVATGEFQATVDQPEAFVILADVVEEAFAATKHWDVMKSAHAVVSAVGGYDVNALAFDPILRKADAEGEAGVHLHKLAADRKKTANDGQHRHLYLIGDKVVATAQDGEHEHTVDAGADRTNDKVAKHSHTVKLPNGEATETDEDGEHDHDMQVATTGWDGSHQHRLKLPDGSTVMSMTAAEFAERFGRSESPAGESADNESSE
jgi:hypothetical protein